MSAKLDEVAKRVHLEYRANVGSCWTGLERLVRDALDEVVAEERKALREIMESASIPEYAKRVLRHKLAARESAPAEPPCRCAGDGHKSDCEFWMSLEPGR
jgi:hypothetical protein